MTDRRDARLVFSTSVGRTCPDCGWPQNDCKCSKTKATASIPSKLVAKLRMEKKGRGGKSVTVVYSLPDNATFLKELSQELKRACGTGGAVRLHEDATAGQVVEAAIELQGDLRDRVREVLMKKGYVVKG
jgi:translation initiation factor 1